MNNLLKNGIKIKGHHFRIQVKCFICDRPVRSFIGLKGYFVCERCNVGRESYKNHIIYHLIGEKRTDQSFRQQKDPQHHKLLGAITVSPLLCINPQIDMIYLFISDIMHFLALIKKIMSECWLLSPLLRNQMKYLSETLMNLSAQVPCEFQRTTRSLAEINNSTVAHLY